MNAIIPPEVRNLRQENSELKLEVAKLKRQLKKAAEILVSPCPGRYDLPEFCNNGETEIECAQCWREALASIE